LAGTERAYAWGNPDFLRYLLTERLGTIRELMRRIAPRKQLPTTSRLLDWIRFFEEDQNTMNLISQLMTPGTPHDTFNDVLQDISLVGGSDKIMEVFATIPCAREDRRIELGELAHTVELPKEDDPRELATLRARATKDLKVEETAFDALRTRSVTVRLILTALGITPDFEECYTAEKDECRRSKHCYWEVERGCRAKLFNQSDWLKFFLNLDDADQRFVAVVLRFLDLSVPYADRKPELPKIKFGLAENYLEYNRKIPDSVCAGEPRCNNFSDEDNVLLEYLLSQRTEALRQLLLTGGAVYVPIRNEVTGEDNAFRWCHYLGGHWDDVKDYIYLLDPETPRGRLANALKRLGEKILLKILITTACRQEQDQFLELPPYEVVGMRDIQADSLIINSYLDAIPQFDDTISNASEEVVNHMLLGVLGALGVPYEDEHTGFLKAYTILRQYYEDEGDYRAWYIIEAADRFGRGRLRDEAEDGWEGRPESDGGDSALLRAVTSMSGVETDAILRGILPGLEWRTQVPPLRMVQRIEFIADEIFDLPLSEGPEMRYLEVQGIVAKIREFASRTEDAALREIANQLVADWVQSFRT